MSTARTRRGVAVGVRRMGAPSPRCGGAVAAHNGVVAACVFAPERAKYSFVSCSEVEVSFFLFEGVTGLRNAADGVWNPDKAREKGEIAVFR